MASSVPLRPTLSQLLLFLFLTLCCLRLPTPVSGCALAIGSCAKKYCDALGTALVSAVSGVPAQYAFPKIVGNPTNAAVSQIGWYQGITNTNATVNSSRGGAYINWEVYPHIGTHTEAGFLVSYANVASLPACCTLCSSTPGCALYHFFGSNNLSTIYSVKGYQGKVDSSNAPLQWPTGHVDNNNCYLLSGGSVNESSFYGTPEGWVVTSPYTPTHSQQINSTNAKIAPGWVGGHCNPVSSVTGDPHFVGARGTKYEFNGAINKTFALISDEKLQLNMKLEGYEDPRTEGATLVKNGKAIRTWIRELGLIWKDSQNKKHTMVMVCRKGAKQDLGNGYLSSVSVDGAAISVPGISDLERKGLTKGLSMQRLKVEKKGYFDVETFTLSVEGLIELKLDLRPAHPLLQTASESFVHFGVVLKRFEATPKVHGVLGQTFRQSSTQTARALEYKMLASLLQAPIAVDAESGKGFLDGSPADYVVADLLATDFRFSGFHSDSPTV